MSNFGQIRYLNDNEREEFGAPLLLNCLGKIEIKNPFRTYNPRGRVDFYLMFFVKGELKIEISGDIFIAKRGDFIIFPPKYKYKYFSDSEEPISYYYAHFTGSYTETLLRELFGYESPKIEKSASYESALRLFEETERYSYDGEVISEASAAHRLFGILLSLVKSDCGFQKKKAGASLDFINGHYTESISVPALARAEGISPSRFNTVFRKETGASPLEYVTNLRIERAKMLLRSTDMPISLVGEESGYKDRFFFSKIFKKHVGLTPKEYRERDLQGD